MNVQACTDALRAKVGVSSGLGATLLPGRFEVSGDMSVAMKLQRVV